MKIAILTAAGILFILYSAAFIGNAALFSAVLSCAFFSLIWISIYFLGKHLQTDQQQANQKFRRLFRSFSACFILLVLFGESLNCYLSENPMIRFDVYALTGCFAVGLMLAWALVCPSRKSIWIAIAVSCAGFLILHFQPRSLGTSSGSDGDVAALATLPYVNWVSSQNSTQKKGVTVYHAGEACPGINIYPPRSTASAYLLDMNGKELHSWSTLIDRDDTWQHVEFLDDGGLLAIVKDKRLLNLAWDSNLRWVHEARFHHDVALDQKGDIFGIARKDEVVFLGWIPLPIVNDYVLILSEKGELRKEYRLFQFFADQISVKQIVRIYLEALSPLNIWRILTRKEIYIPWDVKDLLHTNSIEVLNEPVVEGSKPGDLLLSMRNLDLIAIIDLLGGRTIWSWGPGKLSRQHHPTILDNRNFLIFDNGVVNEVSRVVELNPLKERITWQYHPRDSAKFYSPSRGGNQRLPNGNTLITDSDNGRAFEVTAEGKIVWEFYCPVINKLDQSRAAIYRLMRIIDPRNYPILLEKLPQTDFHFSNCKKAERN